MVTRTRESEGGVTRTSRSDMERVKTTTHRGVGFEARGVEVALARVNLLRRKKLLKPARQHRHAGGLSIRTRITTST